MTIGKTFIAPPLAALATAALLTCQAYAVELSDGEVAVRWDNTVRYGVGYRLKDPTTPYTTADNAPFDDGNRNFNKGLISNRVDLFSELDVSHRNSGLGFRVSAAGWYDAVYNTGNDNPGLAGGAFPNATSVPANQFTRATRNQEGRKTEFRDIFASLQTRLGSLATTVRVGQHALLWGESLFFANNAIAGGQGTFDVSRLAADPTAQAKEFVLPVPQISGQLQLSESVGIEAYYQFRFRENRLPASGSYFSPADSVGAGAENLGPLGIGPRNGDLKGKKSGQGGVKLSWRLSELDTDLGFYAIRFHDKSPQIVSLIGPAPVPVGYYLAYNEGTNAFGVSASRTFGPANIALEASTRRNQGLASPLAADLSALGFGATDNSGHPGYATGNTAHVNLSTLWTLPITPLWNEATLTGEIAWNRLLSCTRNCNTALDPRITRDATALRVVVAPTYRQVLPGLDLDVPFGIGYSPKGSRSSLGTAFPPENGGDITLGLTGTYESVWKLNASYTHYYGKAGTVTIPVVNTFSYLQTSKDRDFVSVSLRRTF